MPLNLPDLYLGIKQVAVGSTPNDGLGDDLRSAFVKVNQNSAILVNNIRQKLSANTIIYVAKSGSDSTGTGTFALPFFTINRAISFLYTLDFNNYTVTLLIREGTYTESVSISCGFIGSDEKKESLIISGYESDVVNVRIPSGESYAFSVTNNSKVLIKNLTFSTNSTILYSRFISVGNYSSISINNLILGANTVGYHLVADAYSTINVLGNYSVTGSALTHIVVINYSTILYESNITVAFQNDITTNFIFEVYTFSFCFCRNLTITGNNISGSRSRINYLGWGSLNDVTFPISLSPSVYEDSINNHNFTNNGSQINNSTSTFNGASTFNANVAFNNTTQFSNTSTFNNVANFNNNVNLNGTSISTTTLATSDNTNKLATCNFVQRVASAAVAALSVIPTGLMSPFAGSTAPSGWLLCDGTVYSVSTYPALFAVIGAIYGGNGTTTFAVPDARGRTTVGVGTGSGLSNRTLGANGGLETVALNSNQLASHSHTVNDAGHSHSVTDPGHNHSINNSSHTHGITDPTHNHIITDPGHTHSVYDPGHAHSVYDAGHRHQLLTSAGLIREISAQVNNSTVGPELSSNSTGNIIYTTNVGTGIGIYSNGTSTSLYAASTGISHSASGTGISVNGVSTTVSANAITTGISTVNNTTGISVQNTGSGGAHENMPPFLVLNYIIKT
jgi:microcystin-dependent protein